MYRALFPCKQNPTSKAQLQVTITEEEPAETTSYNYRSAEEEQIERSSDNQHVLTTFDLEYLLPIACILFS